MYSIVINLFFFFFCHHVTALTPGRQSSLPVIARMFDRVNLAYRSYALEAEQNAQQVSLYEFLR